MLYLIGPLEDGKVFLPFLKEKSFIYKDLLGLPIDYNMKVTDNDIVLFFGTKQQFAVLSKEAKYKAIHIMRNQIHSGFIKELLQEINSTFKLTIDKPLADHIIQSLGNLSLPTEVTLNDGTSFYIVANDDYIEGRLSFKIDDIISAIKLIDSFQNISHVRIIPKQMK